HGAVLVEAPGRRCGLVRPAGRARLERARRGGRGVGIGGDHVRRLVLPAGGERGSERDRGEEPAAPRHVRTARSASLAMPTAWRASSSIDVIAKNPWICPS